MRLLRNLKNRKYVTLDCEIVSNFDKKLEIYKAVRPKIEEIQSLSGVYDFTRFGNTFHSSHSLDFIVEENVFKFDYTVTDLMTMSIAINNGKLQKFRCTAPFLRVDYCLEILGVIEMYCRKVGEESRVIPDIKKEVETFKQFIQNGDKE